MKVRKIKKCNESYSFNKPNSINDAYDISKLIKFINEYNKIDDHSKEYEYYNKLNTDIENIIENIGYKFLSDNDIDISLLLKTKMDNYLKDAEKYYDCYLYYYVFKFIKYSEYGIIIIKPTSKKLGLPFKYILIDLKPVIKTTFNIKEHK